MFLKIVELSGNVNVYIQLHFNPSYSPPVKQLKIVSVKAESFEVHENNSVENLTTNTGATEVVPAIPRAIQYRVSRHFFYNFYLQLLLF